MTRTIPKILFQTSKYRPKKYLVDMIKNLSRGWIYIHFTDEDIIKFFKNNFLYEFPDIIEKFNSIKNGAHKADLFRYYFIYIKGGVFLDSDAMIQGNIDNIVKDYDFMTVESTHYCPSCIFQGFLASKPKNKIIYEALKDAYNIDMNILNNDYLLLCKNLFIILKKKWEYRIKIYKEIYGSDKVAISIDDTNGSLILAHYFASKVVPPEYFNANHITDKNKKSFSKLTYY
jgi:hypothetical protein